MNYLIQQMWICLLLAAFLGVIIGWLLSNLSYRRRINELKATWQRKLESVETERDNLQNKLSSSAIKSPIIATEVETSTVPIVATTTQQTSYPIEEVEGIGKTYGKSIRDMGITTTQELLEKCCQMDGRLHVAENVGIEDFVVQNWVSMCDLMRVSGIDGQISELMVYAGIETVQNLAQKNPERLANTLNKSNQEQNRVKEIPDVAVLEAMINQAKTLNPIILDF